VVPIGKRSVRRRCSVLAVAAISGLAALGLAACGSSGGGSRSASASATSSATSSSAPAAGGSSTSSSGGTSKATGTPLVVGAAIAESGVLQPFDLPAYRAAQFAADDINAQGGILGHPIKFVAADTASVISAGAAAAQTVIGKGASPMVLVSCDFNFGSSAALATEAKGLVAFSECAGSTRFTTQALGPRAYTFGIPDIDDATVGSEYAYNKLHFKTVYILEDTLIDYTQRLTHYFKQKWTQLSGAQNILGTNTFKSTDSSIASQITAIKALKKQPDFIYLASLTPGGASAVRQIRAAGINIPIVAGEGMEGVFWQSAIPHLSNFYYTGFGSLVGDDPRASVNDLVQRYTAKYGKPQISSMIMGYRAIYALKAAAEKANSIDPTKISAALDTFSNLNLPPGISTTFTTDRHVTLDSPMVVMKVSNGKNTLVQFAQPKDEPPVLP
jgi:branched-chain amino acid transport system substrate-binding protein